MAYQIYRRTDSSAISVTFTPNRQWELEGIRLHLSAGGAATDLTVTVDSSYNSAFDIVLLTKAMSGISDYDYRWDPTHKFLNKDDKIVVAYANGGSATWGLEIIYKVS